MIVAQQTENLATPDHMLHQDNAVDEQYLADRASHGTGWITQIVDRTLEETPHNTIHDEYQDLYSRLTSIPREVRENSEIPIQYLIDDVYSLMVSLILNNSQKSTKSQQDIRKR
jgi:hypothetical protein